MFLYTKRQSDNIKLALVERLESYFSELNVQLFVGDSYVILPLASSAFSRKTFIKFNRFISNPFQLVLHGTKEDLQCMKCN